MLTLSLALMVSAAPDPASAPKNEAWVVLVVRSGVPAPRALAVASSVAAHLSGAGVPTSLAVDDLSRCKGRRPCLVDLGRKQKVPAMVLVEVGTVLDDGFARAEAISVDEDGKRVGLAEAEGPIEGLAQALQARLTASVVQPLQELLGVAPPPVLAVEAPPPAPPSAPPSPALVPAVAEAPPEVVAVAEKPFFTPQRVVGVGVAAAGAATLVAAAVFGAQAADAAGQQLALCPAGQACRDPQAYRAYEAAAGAQNAAVVLTAVGAGVAVVGAIIFFTGGDGAPSASATLTPIPGGAAAVLTGSF